MLVASYFSQIKHTEKQSSKSQKSSKNRKGGNECHFKSFKILNSILKSLNKKAITKIVMVIPHTIKHTCQSSKSLKLTTMYANIPNKAVKKANKKVLKNSIFIFVFSKLIKTIIPNFNQYKRRTYV